MNYIPTLLKVIKNIEEQSALLEKLLPMQEEFQHKLNKKFRMEFNYNSNHIEGNTLTYGETELLLIFDRTTGNHSHREYEEMKAHDIAFTLIENWANDKERPLTESDIRDLHKSLLIRPYWNNAITQDGQHTQREIQVGDYKKHPNTVILPNGEKFEFASVTDTPILMGELINWYREEEAKDVFPPFAIAALFHYKFVRIHPFDDGNGRIARLLMNYILLKHNLPPVVVKSSDKSNYLTALNKADTGDLDSFIYYIAKQLEWSLDLSIKAAHGESIEESDDVDKEISIWKKQVSSSSVETLRRNDGLIYQLYTHGIRELFIKLEEKLRQFYDLFNKSEYFAFLNQSGNSGIEWLDFEINKLTINKVSSFSLATNEIYNDTYNNILFRINLEEYKFDKINTFSARYELQFVFHLYKYGILFNDKIVKEKNYREYLTSEEIKHIVADCVKHVFQEIKEQSGK